LGSYIFSSPIVGRDRKEKTMAMTFDEFNTALNGVWHHWKDDMPMMAMEELDELGQAISKYKREPTAERAENLKRELADVYIATEALFRMWGLNFGAEECRQYMEEKLSKKY
jgi:hypothetical protein